MKTIYMAVATVHGGREGHVKSDDGVLDLDLRIPKIVSPIATSTSDSAAVRMTGLGRLASRARTGHASQCGS
jgi:hypothetical protein